MKEGVREAVSRGEEKHCNDHCWCGLLVERWKPLAAAIRNGESSLRDRCVLSGGFGPLVVKPSYWVTAFGIDTELDSPVFVTRTHPTVSPDGR